jgi:hypothetical protein
MNRRIDPSCVVSRRRRDEIEARRHARCSYGLAVIVEVVELSTCAGQLSEARYA